MALIPLPNTEAARVLATLRANRRDMENVEKQMSALWRRAGELLDQRDSLIDRLAELHCERIRAEMQAEADFLAGPD